MTDEKVHDEKILKKLVDNVLDNHNKKKIKPILFDGVYHDSNTNFKYLQEKKINPVIRVRRNPIVSPKKNRLGNRESRLLTKDLLKWKRKESTDGDGLVVEFSFSSIKRMFGEYISATRFQNVVK